MSILYKKFTRPSDPTDKTSVKRIYPVITYKYTTPVTLNLMANDISSNAGVSEGEAISVLKDFRTYLKKRLLEGRTVNIDGLGYFYLSAQSKGTDKAEDFTAADITGLRICFRASNDIRLHTGSTTRTDGLVLRDVDRINKDELTPDDPGSGEGDDPVIS